MLVGEVECEPIVGELVGEDGGWVWIRVPSREAQLIGEVAVEED